MKTPSCVRRLASLALLLGGCGSNATATPDGPRADGPDAPPSDPATEAADAPGGGAEVLADGSTGSRDGGGCLAMQPATTLHEYWCRSGSTELCFTDRMVPF